ncbi:type II secretion system minor pseudopilin GspK [Aquincola sp. MAHUQ-54]|uniref:Type II secretion system protein K n=1 Tax=Aquincola agrisoli TaxID=3119538 RepID=A0AAW9QJ58_9BURK
MPPARPRPPRQQHGAALLMAMIILTLVATLAAGMVYQQDRAIRVESAERAREQTSRVALGGLELARWILRQDATKNPKTDHLGEAWATSLPETELSSLIAGNDRSPTSEQGLRAFMRGEIIDAQSRFNLRNLVDEKNEPSLADIEILRRLCANAGLPAEVAQRIAIGLRKAWATQELQPDAIVAPDRLAQLTWLGIEPSVIDTLRPLVTLLPERGTKINVNTALADVLAAAINGLDRSSAQRIIDTRRRSENNEGFTSTDKVRELFPQLKPEDFSNLSVTTGYFEVHSELRIGDQVTSDVWLLRRRQSNITLVRQERVALRNLSRP